MFAVPTATAAFAPRRAVSQFGRKGRAPARAVCMAASTRLPRLVAFDLDDTIWRAPYPELYMMDGPYKKLANGKIVDSRNEEIKVYPAASKALEELVTDEKWKGVKVAYASRTDQERWALQCLGLFKLANGMTLAEVAGPLVEIQGGTKKKHFANLKEKTGIPYSEMLFFDNERWNCTEVQQLGVTCVYCPGGLTAEFWKNGVAQFEGNKAARQQGR